MLWSRKLRQILQPQQVALLEACLIGLAAGLAAVILEQGAALLGQWRIHFSHQSWLALPAFGLLGGLLSGWLMERFAPESSGSGIPQVKAVLARVPITLNLKTAIFKLLGGIIVLGSGFPLGREGPTVQIGAALAATISRWVPTSPAYRRQLLAAGAGAGLAAAFNAPIAGVIFVIEQLLQDVSGLTLGPAILASFIASVLARVLGDQSFDLQFRPGEFATGFSVQEIPFYILLGGLAGILGALFNRGILTSFSLNATLLRLRLPLRVGLAGLVIGLVITQLPDSFRNNAGLREMISGGVLPWQWVALAFACQFLLTLIAFSSGAPGGLFAPSLVMGTSLGYLIGLLAQSTLGLHSPTTFALAGMGGFFTAVARVPITAIIIVFEMTNDFNLVLPLMIVCTVAYLVAEQMFSGSIYDRLLEYKGIHLEREKVKSDETLLSNLVASEVMQKRVETLSDQTTLAETLQAFARSHHRGFPVVKGKLLVGIVTQSDLLKINQRKLGDHLPVSEIMTPQPIVVSPGESLQEVLFLLNRFKLSRLPVIADRQLMGIITRSDIIRAESNLLNGQHEDTGPAPNPSYTILQTCGPANGQGRLLVALANPHTAPLLLRFAAALALSRNYELECVHIITVPRSESPAVAKVSTQEAQYLLAGAHRLGQQLGLSIHTQIRVAHDVAQAMLELIKQRGIDVILMGGQGTSNPSRIFGNTLDTIIRQAPCEVLLVRLKGEQVPTHWLLPIGGGPNAQEAVKILPALLACAEVTGQVTVCQVFPDEQTAAGSELLEADARALARSLGHPVETAPLYAKDIAKALITYARDGKFDGIILGASRERLLRQVVHGNIPEALMRHSDCTVIVVRT